MQDISQDKKRRLNKKTKTWTANENYKLILMIAYNSKILKQKKLDDSIRVEGFPKACQNFFGTDRNSLSIRCKFHQVMPSKSDLTKKICKMPSPQKKSF